MIDAWLSRWLGRWVDTVDARPRLVLVVCAVATIACAVYAALELGVNSDNLQLISPDLPSRRNTEAFAAHFPNLENALFAVVDADNPELARTSADRLAARLNELPEQIEEALVPGAGRFFERNGLLYRSVDELDEFAVQVARIQPVLSRLESDASLASLSLLVREALPEVRDDPAAAHEWSRVLDRVGRATVDVFAEFPVAVSWDDVLLRGSALDTTTRRVVVVHPVLEFGRVLAADAPIRAIRDSARELDLVPERGIRVRVTGNPALNHEEMIGIAWDIGVAGIFCFALVVAILYFALRSLPLVAATVATLLVGLVWTAAFAAAAVGHLNIASMSVAILFIGLGVDFAIHLGMRYADLLREGLDHSGAMARAVEDVGSSLVLCTGTTSIGFLVFVPTAYLGVAELGLIAGGGMAIIAFLTFTLFPALLATVLHFDPAHHIRSELRFETDLGHWVERHARPLRWGALVLFVVGLALLPRARFDANVVDMRDPDTESVQAFNDLLEDASQLSPWYVDALAPSLDQAVELAHRLRELPEVDRAITLADYVPEDQETKREILADAAFLLDAPAPDPIAADRPTVEEQVEALRELHDFLGAGWIRGDRSRLGASMRKLHQQLSDFLRRVAEEEDPEVALRRLERLLLSNFPGQLERLRTALDPEEVTLETLPRDVVHRMVGPDGHARVQIFPAESLRREGAMREFSEAVQRVAPRATGISMNLVALEDATKASFRQALTSALVLIVALLWLLWRNAVDIVLVVAPMVLAAVLSVAAVGVFDIPFNFVNVIVVPLMFGIGVDCGIHLVHRSHDVIAEGEGLLGTTTARAVYYSALTTLVSFGSLSFSSHGGMASLGMLLSIGMVLTVVANLVVLPALIHLRQERASAP